MLLINIQLLSKYYYAHNIIIVCVHVHVLLVCEREREEGGKKLKESKREKLAKEGHFCCMYYHPYLWLLLLQEKGDCDLGHILPRAL